MSFLMHKMLRVAGSSDSGGIPDWSSVTVADVEGGAFSAMFNPAGSRLAVGHIDSSVNNFTLYDTSDWSKIVGTPTFPGERVYGVAFSPDGKYLALGHTSGLKIVDGLPGSGGVTAPSIPGAGLACSFSPDGAYLAVGSSSAPYLTIIDTSDWSIVTGAPVLNDPCGAVAFNNASSILAVGHEQANSGNDGLSIFNVPSWVEVTGAGPGYVGDVNVVAFSPNDSLLLVGGDFNGFAGSFSGDTSLLQTTSWGSAGVVPQFGGEVYGLAFSPDGSYFGVAGNGNPSFKMVVTAGLSAASSTFHPATFNGRAVAFSDDGNFLAVIGTFGTFVSVYSSQ